MNIKNILESLKLKNLSPNSFKAYLYLLNESGEKNIIKNFTILGKTKEWAEDKNMNLISSKNTMKKILKELQINGLVLHNKAKKELLIKNPNSKTIFVQTDPKTGDGFIDLEEFKDMIDISKVHSYKIVELGGQALSIEFYDKNGKIIKSK